MPHTKESNILEYYDQYAPVVFKSAWRFLGTREDAEDITQEVFGIRIREIPNDVKNPRNWILRVANNLCRDIIRQRYIVKFQSLDNLIANTSFSPEINEESFEFIEIAEVLQQRFRLLTNHETKVFNLAVLRDLPHQKIAKNLSISEINSRKTLNRARNKLFNSPKAA